MNASLTVAEPPVLDCEQTVRRLWDYLDQQLSVLETHAVDQHLRDCKTMCASHFAFERAFLGVVRSARPTNVVSDALRLRIQALMTKDDFPNRGEET